MFSRSALQHLARALSSLLALLAVLTVAPALNAQDNSAQRLILEAERQIQNGNVREGLAEYAAVVERYPQSPLAPTALLQTAWVQYGSNLPTEADASAKALIERYPDSREAAAGFVIQGRIAQEAAQGPGDLDRARNSFNRVPLLYGSERFPTLASRTEARVRSADASFLLGDFDEASAAYLEALEDEPNGPFTSNAHLGFGRVLLMRGDWVSAMQFLQQVLVQTDGDPLREDLNQTARQYLTLAHRLFLRPSSGQQPWLSSRALAFTGLELKRPRSIAADAAGRLVLVDSEATLMIEPSGQFTRVSEAKSVGRPWFTAQDEPFLPVGTVMQSVASRRTSSFTLGGDKPKALDKMTAGSRGVFREWVVLDQKASDAAHVFNRDTRYLRSLAIPGGRATDVAVDPLGRILVLDGKGRKVLRFGIGGTLEESLSVTLDKPDALDVDGLGNIYVLDSSNKQIRVTTAAGVDLVQFGPTLPGGLTPRSIDDLAVDGFGRIYLTSRRDGSVLVIE